jgi:PAS domain S-box-containing protein
MLRTHRDGWIFNPRFDFLKRLGLHLNQPASTSTPLIGAMMARFPALASIAILATVYWCAAKIGLSLAYLHPSASAVWPASGIAFAALLLAGSRVWPGILLGAFLANFMNATPAGTSLAIAIGNTLEAILGAWLISRYADGRKVFARARDIFTFVFFVAPISTAVAATAGVSSLAITEAAPWAGFGTIWLTWWLGDMTGVLLVSPLILIWLTEAPPAFTRPRLVEAAAVLLSLLAVGAIVFFTRIATGFEALAILPLLWASFRFGQHGAVSAAIMMSAMAVIGTVQGSGPFSGPDLNTALLNLQSFTGTFAIAALVLAAATKEGVRVEQRLKVQNAVSRIIVESSDLKTAGPRLLQVLCEQGGWSTGALWEVDRKAGVLVCVEMWRMPHVYVPQFEAATRRRKFEAGIGLPGRVWSTGGAAWISDVVKDDNFPRAPVARQEGLHAAFGFPIKLGGKVLGVVECFSHEVRSPDEHFLEMARDIGQQLGPFIERRRAEEALLQSEKELSDFFDTASLGLHWVGADGTILRANPAELKMLGYSEKEYVGRNIVDFHVDHDGANELLRRLTRGEALREHAAQMRCKDGSVRDVLIDSSTYWKDGEFVHTRCFTRDVTLLKRAEEARATLAAIVESSDDAIVSKDLNGIVISWNRGAERIFGHPAEEMVGQSILRIIPPDRHNEEKEILARLRRGERIEHYETIRVARDGRPLDISLTVSPVRDAEGKIIGASKIARDITNRKRAEELLRRARADLVKANEELEQRVRARTAALEQAHAALLESVEEQKRLEDQLRQAQKMESIGTLAGGIAHDFNNVLNIIRGYATLVSRRAANEPHIIESMQIINDEIDRGAAVVRQLLTVARKTATILTRTDANSVVITVSELIKQTFPKTIEISRDLRRGLPGVLADANQLNQALLNICVNARDAMPDGGSLSFATGFTTGGKIKQQHPDGQAGSYVWISIADTGTGIDEKVRARIFEPFFTTKGFGQGTGLGLAMVYGLIKNHNGFIDVESTPGKGTTFTIYLPACEQEDEILEENAGPQASRPANSSARGTVLVVEDEERMIRLLRDVLQQSGYGVITATDGEQAIRRFRAHAEKIDMVLLDLNLPKANGADVVRALLQHQPNAHIIVASGYLEPEVKQELLDIGVKEYLQKPYVVDEILEKVQAAAQPASPLGSSLRARGSS